MIYAELAGGLGNQMFIYAFARALGLRCGEPVTLLDRQDWRDGAPAHTVCALDALNISPDVKIIADAGFAKAHLPRRNAAKALMIKYEQRRGLMARDWHSFEAAAAPLLNAVGLHFATDGYTPRPPRPRPRFPRVGVLPERALLCGFCPYYKGRAACKSRPRRALCGADHRRRVPCLRPSAPRRLPEARERDLTGLHAGLLRPRCRSGQGRTPRRRVVCLFRRHRLGAGASGHRGSARRVPAPRRGRRRPGLHAALPRLCPEQLHLQLVGAVPCPRPR